MNHNTTIKHLGGQGLSGALVYTGTSKIMRMNEGLRLVVKGKSREQWSIYVTLNGRDLYDVSLTRYNKRTYNSVGRTEQVKNVYSSELQQTVEQLYDRAIKKYNRGFVFL